MPPSASRLATVFIAVDYPLRRCRCSQPTAATASTPHSTIAGPSHLLLSSAALPDPPSLSLAEQDQGPPSPLFRNTAAVGRDSRNTASVSCVDDRVLYSRVEAQTARSDPRFLSIQCPFSCFGLHWVGC
ncbi:hypothetical protein NL676_008348 [Syzygium grande]|nr:hypothetical protein NL676_008348 [Syzygium grande]